MKKDIVHPVFLRIASQMDDTFWKYIYEDLSYAKCPYGIYISNDNICCNYKDKKFCYNIYSSNNPSVIFKEICELFKDKFGLLSKKDKLLKNKMFIKKQEEINDILNNSWSNIKRKNIRVMLIEKFVINQSLKYSLTLHQTKELYNKIILGLLFKTIHKGSIVYENQNIKEIKSISFKKNSFTLKKNLYNFKKELIFID